MLFVRPGQAVQRVKKTGDLFQPLLEMRQHLNAPKRARRSGSA